MAMHAYPEGLDGAFVAKAKPMALTEIEAAVKIASGDGDDAAGIQAEKW